MADISGLDRYPYRVLHHLQSGGNNEHGGGVSSGTSSSYWADKGLPSVFKHELGDGNRLTVRGRAERWMLCGT